MNRLESMDSRGVDGGVPRRALCAAAAIAACAIALPLSSAAAQEAPDCVKGEERLDDGINKWNGKNGRDSVTGLRGRDHLNGHGGDDLINGGRDNDVVEGGDGNDRIYGGGESHGEIVDDGIDILDGGFNDDIIEAGGADTLYGYTHNDILSTKMPLIAPAV